MKRLSIHTHRILLRCLVLFAALTLLFIFVLPLLKNGSSTEGEDLSETISAEDDYISINNLLSNGMSDFEQSKTLDNYVEKFMKRWEIKGGSLAVIKDGKLIYAKGYGWADEENGIKTDVSHIFRLASLSKLVTAAAIMKLREDSLLQLDDKVFGEGGILDCEQFSVIKDKRVRKITVDHLLRHMGGFTLHRGDPLFTTREIMLWEKLDSVPDMDRIIQYALTQRLGYTPGHGFRYSNLGYLILTKIVEAKSGMDYEEYCQKNILHPAGCYDMHLAHNLYEERYPNEVRYYETHDAEPVLAYDNSGDTLWRRYGGTNIEGLIGAGAWVASPTEYVRLVAAMDNDGSIPDILSGESIMTMVNDSINKGYPIGWVRASLNSDWVRTGTLAGTSAIAKRQNNGYIWMFVTNTSSWKGSRFTRYIERMYRSASASIEWPDRDLFKVLDK